MIDLYNSFDFRRNVPWSGVKSSSCGIVRNVVSIQDNELGVPAVRRRSASLCNVSLAYPWIRSLDGYSTVDVLTAGSGGDLSNELAHIRSVAEAAERYASAVYDEREVIVASANELGGEALDYRRWPACSDAELAQQECRIRSFDPSAPIRWFKGHSLKDDRPVWLPLVMSHIVFDAWPAEAFWLPITTGIATHSCPFQAAVSAICESIERDAIALTWLWQLPLPRLHLDRDPPDAVMPIYAATRNLPLENHFFDATTDLGVPTVYLLQHYDGHPVCANFVACSTEFDPWNAYGKVIREACVGRTAIPYHQDIPDDPASFTTLEAGASYMGRPERSDAFDFLINSTASRPVSALAPDCPSDARARFDWLLRRFKALDLELTLVDLTTDDLREAGLWVVRAFTPDLMPLDFLPSSRFLQHPRLLDYPVKAGFGPRHVDQLNPFPQPFA